MKYTLIIETSTERGIVALVKEDQVLFCCKLPPGLQSSHYLLPELDTAMRNVGISLSEVGLVCAGIGPGSYTGMRIGATVAKTLSYTLQIPLVGVCSLHSFVPEENGPYAVVIDAKIGGVYVQIGQMIDGIAHYSETPSVLPIADAALHLGEIPVIVTPNSVQVSQKFSGNYRWEESYPSPLQMNRLAKEKFKAGEFSLDGRLELLYMRKTQAEINLEKSVQRTKLARSFEP